MITISHKSKQYLLAALKVFILAITFGYIYSKFTALESSQLTDFFSSLTLKDTYSLSIILFVFMAMANWFFEILKWKTLVSTIKPITFRTAMQQSLASLTVSLATPNRIGDYGAKALFYKPELRKQILLLNFFSNSMQMSATCFFGTIGLFFVVPAFRIDYSIIHILIFLGGILLLLIFGYLFKEKQLLVKGLSVSNVVSKFKKLPSRSRIKVFLYSILRYFIFCCLFYLLLIFFGADVLITEGIMLIFSMYLLVSIIPTIFIFDVVVRGGVAVWLFSMAGIPEMPVASTVLSMWLLNFVFPAICGSFYVLTYKTKAK